MSGCDCTYWPTFMLGAMAGLLAAFVIVFIQFLRQDRRNR